MRGYTIRSQKNPGCAQMRQIVKFRAKNKQILPLAIACLSHPLFKGVGNQRAFPRSARISARNLDRLIRILEARAHPPIT